MKFTKPLVTLAAASALFLGACTGGDGGGSGEEAAPVPSDATLSGTIQLQTWSLKGDKFTPYFEKVLADFKELHPDLTIEWLDQPGDGYEDKVLQQAESGELPDVVNLPDSFAYQLAKAGKLVDLRAADPETMDKYVEGAQAGYTFEGLEGTFAYPWYLGTDLSWWNTEQLKEVGVEIPTTQEEFMDAAKTAAEKSNGAVRLVSTIPDITTLEDAGVEVYDGEKFTFNTEQAAQALQGYVDLYAAGAMPPEALNNDYAGNAALFTQGKVGFTTATSSFANQLETDSPNLIPQVEVTKRLVTPPLFVQGISVAKESDNMQAAMAFAQYLTNDDNQIEFVKLAQGFLPGTKAANDDPSKFAAPDASELMKKATALAAESMADADPSTILVYTDDMKQFVGQQMALALQGKTTPQEALDKSVEYCNQSLQS